MSGPNHDGTGPSSLTSAAQAATAKALTGLHANDLDAWYGQTQVLFGIDLHVNQREIVGLLGHNGSGKSTVLRVLAGLHSRASYSATLEGERLECVAPHAIARRGLVLVRGADVFEGITVEEHLQLGVRLGRLNRQGALDPGEIYEHAPILEKFRRRYATELSGGQRQLLALGMALVANPRCMLLDEPSTGLDATARNAVAKVLSAFSERGVPLLVVEQNPTWLAQIAERAYLLEIGKVIAEGAPLDLVGAGGTRAGANGDER